MNQVSSPFNTLFVTLYPKDRCYDPVIEAVKLLAMATMAIDHIGYAFFPTQLWLRAIGRITFPFYTFLAVRGAQNSRDFKRYVLRLLALALITEMPHGLFIGNWHRLNTVFTLLLVTLAAKDPRYIVPAGILSYFLPVEYGLYGYILGLSFILFREGYWKWLSTAAVCLATVWAYTFGGQHRVQLYAMATPLLLMALYATKATLPFTLPQWIYRTFYPVHLLVLWLIKVLSTTAL